jgi:hypothetical protein
VKACPWCGELIRKQALVCRFCQRDVGFDPRLLGKLSAALVALALLLAGLTIWVCVLTARLELTPEPTGDLVVAVSDGRA